MLRRLPSKGLPVQAPKRTQAAGWAPPPPPGGTCSGRTAVGGPPAGDHAPGGGIPFGPDQNSAPETWIRTLGERFVTPDNDGGGQTHFLGAGHFCQTILSLGSGEWTQSGHPPPLPSIRRGRLGQGEGTCGRSTKIKRGAGEGDSSPPPPGF